MELKSILESLENKSILVTGSTGFLAKIFVEKILRVQPNVKRLYLLIRANNTKSAKLRLEDEVTGKELFRVLREKHGGGFDSFISSKVKPIAGDATLENLGIESSELRDNLWGEVNVVVNSAATTKFDERYDVSLGVNTFGAKHVLEFAKKCTQLEMFLHVSTAFVCGEKSGLILEKPVQMGETLNENSGLDIQQELKLVNEKLDELHAQEVSKEVERFAMKEFGLKRARFYGWPNTYVFTKALGEMLIGVERENLPIVIVRPTVVTSTYKEPFPGWVEGVRTIDSLAAGYGKGKITCFLGDPESILDMIPGDMVVNAIISTIVAHANQPAKFIYHVGSSVANPLNPMVFSDYGYCYFSKNPCIDKDGNPVIVRKANVFTTIASFHRYMTIRYILPLKVLKLMNIIFFQRWQGLYNDLNKKISFVMFLVTLFQPYIFFKGVFDDLNTERLRMATRANKVEGEMFYFDPKTIDWDDYFLNIHIPGFVKYVLNDNQSR